MLGNRQDQSWQPRAGVDAQYQEQRKLVMGEQPAVGEHDKQKQDRKARMGEPCQQRRDKEGDYRLACQRGQQRVHDIAFLHDLRRRGERTQGQEYAAKPHEHAPALFAKGIALVEGRMDHVAGEEQNRPKLIDLESEHLRDQRAADIGAEHDRQPGPDAERSGSGKGSGDQGDRSRALQRHRRDDANGKRVEPVGRPVSQRAPDTAAERAGHAGTRHARAP